MDRQTLQTDGQTDTQTDRHTDTQTHRQKDIHTDTDTYVGQTDRQPDRQKTVLPLAPSSSGSRGGGPGACSGRAYQLYLPAYLKY